MGVPDVLTQAHEAYDQRAWGRAFQHLQDLASREADLGVADLERLGVAAHMTGRNEVATEAFERLHHALLDRGDVAGAARWAVWLAILLSQRGQHAQGSGWWSRADRLLAGTQLDGPERAYLQVPVALQALGSGDGVTAHAICEEVASVAEEFHDADLRAMGVLGLGQALIATGEPRRGVAMLDEAMVAVTTGEVSPIMAGIAYCALIIACREVFDLRRAHEWTAVLSRWCSDQEDLHPYRGQCLVHRAEIMQLRGDWAEAMEEVEAACAHLAEPPGDPVMGMARYQQAELLRLRGDLRRAEAAYRQASEAGHPIQPGLALLRLAQGRVADAVVAIRREVDAAVEDRVRRARVLAAHVDILLADGDVPGATSGVEELEALAADFDSLYLQAVAAQGRGAVLLADDDATGACVALRRAWQAWQALQAPYEAAEVRLLVAEACRELGDHDTADMEVDAARRVFEQLGAVPALVRASELARTEPAAPPGGLTPREVEVLRLVATGMTNREVADRLVISERTVGRHLENLFTKLGVSSRAAATAWAYEHELVRPSVPGMG